MTAFIVGSLRWLKNWPGLPAKSEVNNQASHCLGIDVFYALPGDGELMLSVNRIINTAILVVTVSLFAACGGGGGGGGSGDGTQEPSNAQSSSNLSKQYFYVDLLGACDGRLPCYVTLFDALRASFLAQFDESLVAQRVGAPADQIVVMPGIYYSLDPSDFVIGVGILAESRPTDRWKLEIIAEEGPGQTFITGLGVGPCIDVTDNIDLVISGFTITDCSEYQTGIINEDYSIFLQSYYEADILIEDNVFDGNQSEEAAIAISPWVINVSNLNIRVTRNTFKNNQGSIYLGQFPSDALPEYSSSIIIDNNAIYTNQAGIRIGNFTSAINNISIDILYNTIVNNLNTGISIQQTNGINVINNIVYGNGLDIRGTENDFNYWDRYGVTENSNTIHNNLVGEISSLSATNNLVGDPLLTNIGSEEFAPQIDSPVIDSGAPHNIGAIDFDFLGNQRVQDGDNDLIDMPDIGAIEAQ